MINFSNYTFLLGDMNQEAINYSLFNKNPSVWDQDNRDWKYEIVIEKSTA